MSDRLDPAIVWLRATCAGSLALTMGVAGHVMADGLLPGPAVLVLLATVSVVATVPMVARPLTAVRAVVLMVGGQTAVHLTLTLTAGHRGDPPVAHRAVGDLASALPVHDGRRVGSLQDAYVAASGQHGGMSPKVPIAHLAADLSAHAPMMVVHLLAAAVVGLWLGWGERALAVALTLLAARILAIVVPLLAPVVPHPHVRSAAVARVVPLLSQWRAGPGLRRGPPLVHA